LRFVRRAAGRGTIRQQQQQQQQDNTGAGLLHTLPRSSLGGTGHCDWRDLCTNHCPVQADQRENVTKDEEENVHTVLPLFLIIHNWKPRLRHHHHHQTAALTVWINGTLIVPTLLLNSTWRPFEWSLRRTTWIHPYMEHGHAGQL